MHVLALRVFCLIHDHFPFIIDSAGPAQLLVSHFDNLINTRAALQDTRGFAHTVQNRAGCRCLSRNGCQQLVTNISALRSGKISTLADL